MDRTVGESSDGHRDRTLLFECRHCGRKSDRPRAWCRACGSVEIARYDFSERRWEGGMDGRRNGE